MSILIPLQEGFNEIRLGIISYIIRKASIPLTIAGLVSSIVEGSQHVKVIADKRIGDVNVNNFDALILIGGDPGYKNLLHSSRIINLIKSFDEKNKIIGAVDEAPIVLAKAGILENRIATCKPGFEREIPKPRSHKLVRDGHIITARGVEGSILLGLKIVELLGHENRSLNIKNELGV